jgi:hypothetical protein
MLPVLCKNNTHVDEQQSGGWLIKDTGLQQRKLLERAFLISLEIVESILLADGRS